MADSDSLISDDTKANNNEQDELSGLTGDIFRKIPIKMSILLFFLYILLNSDIFIENIMCNIEGTVMLNQATSLGVILQSFILVLTFIIISIFAGF